jgi:hypothetical protein
MDRKARRQDILVALLIGSAFFVGLPVWIEITQGPRHEQNAMIALRREGFGDARLTRDWFRRCVGKGNRRYIWRTSEASGYVCTYERGTPYAGVHLVSAR